MKRGSSWTYRNKNVFGKPLSALHLISRRRFSGLPKILSLAVLCVFCFCAAFAERLPLKIYSTADGLANDEVNRVVADSRGFLWICTGEGLSRFDGYRFKNYTQEQGLPHRNINDLFETKDGDYLVATSGGLAVFNPLGKAFRWNIVEGRLEQTTNDAPLFRTFLTPAAQNDNKTSKAIINFATDADGNIYAGTTHGLFRIIKSETDWRLEKVEFADELKNLKDNIVVYNFLFTDSKKNMWIATSAAIYLLSHDGVFRKVNESGGNSVFEDRSGKIWVDSGGNQIGIRIYSYGDGDLVPKLINTYSTKDGLFNSGFSNAVAQTADGRIFVTSEGKLYEFLPGAKENEPKFRRIENEISAAATDKSGNIWFSTLGKGVGRYSPNSFNVYDTRDGLSEEFISSIFGGANGDVFLTSGKQTLARLANDRIESLKLFGMTSRDWLDTGLDFQSKDGEFWIPSLQGLNHYPKVEHFADLARTPPKKIYTVADGLKANTISSVFEASSGDLWLTMAADGVLLGRLEKATDKIHLYTTADGFPENSGTIAFSEDAAKNAWFGFYFGQIGRFKDGKFRDFTDEKLLPRSAVAKFLLDKKKRLWLATKSRGLFRVDEPDAEKPGFTNFSAADGLSSNQALCLAEDRFGRIYVGTGRGINRLEPETGRVKIFTQNDGLPGNVISKCFADANGNLWFSSNNTLIKYTPTVESVSTPPPIFIDAVSIAGKPRNISELGEKEITKLELAPEEKQIQISFFAISFDTGETLRYQYKLNDQDWSAPAEQRNVDFNLAAGDYTFAVRAITADGVLSDTSASVSFTIARPVWQRWWFLAAAAIFVSLLIFVIYRRRTENLRRINAALTEAKLAEENLRKAREERLAELQKVRSRIATDLHDDIGSSLTQIAVYSEVARQREREKGTAGEPLDLISNVANELVDTMSDIVWAINPKKDHLSDLTQRMRRFAANVLTAKDIDLEFQAPASDTDIPLGANIRREVFLIFKETVNNIVKHSEARSAEITFALDEHFLLINFKDNGKGFDPDVKTSENGHHDWKKFRGGNGLQNMRKRAKDLGGSYRVESESGKGTNVTLQIPLEIKFESVEKSTQTGDVLPKTKL